MDFDYINIWSVLLIHFVQRNVAAYSCYNSVSVSY